MALSFYDIDKDYVKYLQKEEMNAGRNKNRRHNPPKGRCSLIPGRLQVANEFTIL